MHYISVVGKNCNFGNTFSEDPLDVIAGWRKAGGIAFSSSFIPWHTITEITFERDYKPLRHEAGQ